MSTLISTTSETEGTDTAPEPASRADRMIEIVAVIILGLTTLGTAWCAFQASRWNSEATDLSRQAATHQLDGSRQFGLATQTATYDTMIATQYAQALADGNTRLVGFYRTTLIRPDFMPVLQQWEADIRAGRVPAPLSENPDYVGALFADYSKSIEAAEQSSRDGRAAGNTSSAYVSVTILLAVALFFAGVTSSFKFRPSRALLLAAALATLALAASRLAGLPVML
jgi:hypothetical protein